MGAGMQGKAGVEPIRPRGRQPAVRALMQTNSYPQPLTLSPKRLVGWVTEQPPLDRIRPQKYSFPPKLCHPAQLRYHLCGIVAVNSSYPPQHLCVIAAKVVQPVVVGPGQCSGQLGIY